MTKNLKEKGVISEEELDLMNNYINYKYKKKDIKPKYKFNKIDDNPRYKYKGDNQ